MSSSRLLSRYSLKERKISGGDAGIRAYPGHLLMEQKVSGIVALSHKKRPDYSSGFALS